MLARSGTAAGDPAAILGAAREAWILGRVLAQFGGDVVGVVDTGAFKRATPQGLCCVEMLEAWKSGAGFEGFGRRAPAGCFVTSVLVVDVLT